jgi:hypothetical protein
VQRAGEAHRSRSLLLDVDRSALDTAERGMHPVARRQLAERRGHDLLQQAREQEPLLLHERQQRLEIVEIEDRRATNTQSSMNASGAASRR